MNWQTFIHTNKEKIEPIFGQEESISILKKTAEYITRLNYAKIKGLIPDISEIQKTEAIISQLLTGKPFQYITEEAWFYKYLFKLNSSVLIPRPETEELIEWICRDIWDSGKWKYSNSILDIGTGSGCIPISIKKERPTDIITGIDISEDALKIAKDNASNLKADIKFIQLDFLEDSQWNALEQYDYIISNPPYIPLNEKESLSLNVRSFEPHIALFVPNENPLLFYEKIAAFGNTHLMPGGCIFVEMHYQYAKETKQLFEETGYENVEIRKDISGNERMLKAVM
jgi:release factor glutamine methyltransferase